MAQVSLTAPPWSLRAPGEVLAGGQVGGQDLGGHAVHAGLHLGRLSGGQEVESVRRQKHRAGDDHHLARFPGEESGELCAGVVRAGGDKFRICGETGCSRLTVIIVADHQKTANSCAFQGFAQPHRAGRKQQLLQQQGHFIGVIAGQKYNGAHRFHIKASQKKVERTQYSI